MPTPRRYCPLSLKPQPSALDVPGNALKVDVAPCIGASCQLWQFEPGGDPQEGECSFVITAQSVSLVAHLAQRAFEAGKAEAQEGVARG